MTQEYHICVQIDLLTHKGVKVDYLSLKEGVTQRSWGNFRLHLAFVSVFVIYYIYIYGKATSSQQRKEYALHI